jgi:D-glycerate 3-kinase
MLNGCQGSGKTTLSDYLCTALREDYGLGAVSLSLDDFYLTRAERKMLADSVHPLLATRGVPGTHDTPLLHDTLLKLLDTRRTTLVAIPQFDKAKDDRRPANECLLVEPSVQLILLEGWCLGAGPQPFHMLSQPLNDLEREKDPDGSWRTYSNDVLRRNFQPLYTLLDQSIMLCAPSFECVFNWRREQEHRLADGLPSAQSNRLMDDKALAGFIQHFERITRYCLEHLPPRVNHLYLLDEKRQITAYIRNSNTSFSR